MGAPRLNSLAAGVAWRGAQRVLPHLHGCL